MFLRYKTYTVRQSKRKRVKPLYSGHWMFAPNCLLYEGFHSNFLNKLPACNNYYEPAMSFF